MAGARWMRPAAVVSVTAMVAIVACAQAWAWPWDKKQQENAPNTELPEVMKSPSAFVGRTVIFSCRFAMNGKLFKHFNTRFNASEHANFAVWPMKTKLWDKAARRNVLPTLYIDKSRKDFFTVLRSLRRYEKITVTGQVVSTYAGLPWLLVESIRREAEEGGAVTDTAIVHIRHALELMDNNKPMLAARHLEAARKNGAPAEQDAFIAQTLAKAYGDAGETEKALALYTEAVEKNDTDPELHLELAQLYLKQGKAQEALDASGRVLALSSEYPEAYAIRGEAYGKLGELDKALEQTRLAENDPGIAPKERAMALVHRARIYADAGRYADAVRSYASAISGESELSGAAWLRKEIGLLYESRFDASGRVALLEDAEREYANANVLSNNSDVEGLFMAARVAFKRSKSEKSNVYDKAQTLLLDALKVDSGYVPAMLLQGEIALAQNDTETAEKIFEQVAAVSGGSPEALLALASTYETMKKSERAKSVYEKVIAVAPENRKALNKHAALAKTLGDLAGAKQSYAKLSELEPDDATYNLNVGRICLALGEYNAAATAFSKATHAGGTLGEDAGVLEARALELAGNAKQSEHALRSVLKKNPTNPAAAMALAKLLADQMRNAGEAVRLAKVALDADPELAEAKDVYAWAQTRAGQYPAALETLSGIPTEKMTRATWYHKSVAQFFAKQYSEARVSLEKVLAPLGETETKSEADVLIQRGKELLEMINKAEAVAKREAKNNARLKAREEARAIREKKIEKREQQILEREAKALNTNEFGPVTKEVTIEEPVAVEETIEVAVVEEPLAKEDTIDAEVGIETTATREMEAEVPETKDKDLDALFEELSDATEIKTEKEATVQITLDDEFFEIPGIMAPETVEDISTLTAPLEETIPAEKNEVLNLPLPVTASEATTELEARDEIFENIAALAEVQVEVELPDELPVLDEANAPVERTIEAPFEPEEITWTKPERILEEKQTVTRFEKAQVPEVSDAPSILIEQEKRATSETVQPAVPAAKTETETFPKNNISDLPDWAM